MGDHGTQLETEPTMGGQQRITGHVRSHRAIAQDEVREDREHRFTCGALYPPDRDATQADTGVMGVPRQAPTATTGGLVLQLKAEGQDEGEDTFEERLAIVQQLEIGRFILKIDSDRTVLPGPFGSLPHVSLQRRRSWKLKAHNGGNTLKLQASRDGLRRLPRNRLECR